MCGSLLGSPGRMRYENRILPFTNSCAHSTVVSTRGSGKPRCSSPRHAVCNSKGRCKMQLRGNRRTCDSQPASTNLITVAEHLPPR